MRVNRLISGALIASLCAMAIGCGTEATKPEKPKEEQASVQPAEDSDPVALHEPKVEQYLNKVTEIDLFQLSKDEQTLYDQLKKKFDYPLLKGVDPITQTKLLIHAQGMGDHGLEYDLYLPTASKDEVLFKVDKDQMISAPATREAYVKKKADPKVMEKAKTLSKAKMRAVYHKDSIPPIIQIVYEAPGQDKGNYLAFREYEGIWRMEFDLNTGFSNDVDDEDGVQN
ncbi:hypothetical protein J2Z48_000332 [Croceifilum oryzae]|uniref:Uncharacterized protein n=1 Tax=Croceifilum oryzae TaxID=1553429 RepID=A0AAJ1TCU5_9BACL|nr:hypothetical protein [Croceifilum oryzae]MDQ0416174.1 hypothetical protein [Croceifilum oryzae]